MKAIKVSAIAMTVILSGCVVFGLHGVNTKGAAQSNATTKFWKDRKKTWVHPLKGSYYAISKFGAPRSRGRLHAAIDFIVRKDTAVYSMTSGTVYGINKTFYKKGNGKGYLHAVEIKNSDGTYAVYGEVMEAGNIKKGNKIKKGQKIATIKHDGDSSGPTRMLHLEIYKGTSSGSFYTAASKYKYVKVSRGNTYSRRSDLINPMTVKQLKKLK